METQTPQPTPSTPTPPLSKNNSNIIIGILVFILGIIVGLVIDRTAVLSTIRIPYIGATPTPTIVPTPTADSSRAVPRDWKTYTNSASFYTLKYPTTWRVIEREQLLVAGPFIVSDTEWNLSTANEIPNINIIVYKSDSDFAKSIASGGTKVVVGGKTAIKNTTEEPTFTISYVFTNSAYTYFISLETESNQESSQYEPLFDQILSTFTFLGQ